MQKFIQLEDVTKIYKMGEVEIKALDNISFSIDKGQFVVIVGPSGAGKSTLLNILGGMDSPTSGKLIVDNEDISKYSSRELITYRRYDIGFVFQFYNLVQNLTALENVELATEICKNPLDPEKILEQVGLKDRKNNFPAQLSGGEQQRVSIARALAKNPKLLLCDEPTGALDYNTGKSVLKLLQDTCRERGMTVIVVTHNLAITPMADKVIRIKNGKVESEHINENSETYSFSSDGYTIITEAGDVSDGTIKNMLLQPAGGAWAAKAEVILSEIPSQNNQQAGLILYQDNNNHVKLTYERVSSTNYFSLYNTVNGTRQIVSRSSVSGITRPYFMFVKSGMKVEGYYSTDGFKYNLLGSVEVDMTNPKLGPYACNGIGSTAPSISATFPHVVIIDDPAGAFGTLAEIKVNGKPLKGFSPDVLNYTYVLTRNVTGVPQVEAIPLKDDMNVFIENAQAIPGTTRITVSSKGAWRTYEIGFGYGPVSSDFTKVSWIAYGRF